MRMFNSVKVLVCLALLAMTAVVGAVAPPTPPAGDKLSLNVVLPTTRVNGSALATSEIRQVTYYISSLTSPIVVVGPTTSFVYTLPVGVCLKATDQVAATVTDTGGLESAGSVPVAIGKDLCGPKLLPSAPTVKTS